MIAPTNLEARGVLQEPKVGYRRKAHATELAILTGIAISLVDGAFELVSYFGLF